MSISRSWVKVASSIACEAPGWMRLSHSSALSRCCALLPWCSLTLVRESSISSSTGYPAFRCPPYHRANHLKRKHAACVKLQKKVPDLLVQVSRLLLAHVFAREATSGMQAFDKVFDRLEKRNRSGLFSPCL